MLPYFHFLTEQDLPAVFIVKPILAHFTLT